jgi:hypothetical protein
MAELGGAAAVVAARKRRPLQVSPAASPEPRIPVILCIDVEPDPFQVDRDHPEPWHGYEALHPYLSDLRGRFEEATGSPVHYAWFFRMDPQIAESYGSPTWAAERYAKFVTEADHRGDELASHPHGYRWLEEERCWLEDLGSQDWMDHCLEMALDAHETAFGRPSTTLRFGNFWLSTASVNLAERRGIRYDLTIEPGRPPFMWDAKGKSTGELPEVYRVPRTAYEPSRDDFRESAPRGSRAIRMIPLTSAWLDLGFRVGARVLRWLRNGRRYRMQDTPLSMWRNWSAPDTFDRMLDRAIAVQERPYLAFAIRSSSGLGPSFERVDHCLRALLRHRERERFVFCTPAEAMRLLGEEDASEV